MNGWMMLPKVWPCPRRIGILTASRVWNSIPLHITSVGEYLKYKYLKYYFKYMNSILCLYFKYFNPEVLVLVFKILLHEYLVF